MSSLCGCLCRLVRQALSHLVVHDQAMVLQKQQLTSGVSKGGESGWMGQGEHAKLMCCSLKADVCAALPVRQEKVFVSFTEGTVFGVRERKEPCSLSF